MDNIGVNAIIATTPNPSMIGSLPSICAAIATLIDKINVEHIGPVATPPLSKAIAQKILSTFRPKINASPYPGIKK